MKVGGWGVPLFKRVSRKSCYGLANVAKEELKQTSSGNDNKKGKCKRRSCAGMKNEWGWPGDQWMLAFGVPV